MAGDWTTPIYAPTATDVTGIFSNYVLRDFVPGLTRNTFFMDYTEPAVIAAGSAAHTATWNVPTMRGGSTTPLVDGTISGNTNMVTLTPVEATVRDYGEWMAIGRLADAASIPAALDSYREIAMESGARALDDLTYAQATSGVNMHHSRDLAVNGSSLVSTDTLIAQDLPIIAGFFRSNDAKGFDSLGGDYMLAINPNQEVDLVTDVTNARLSWAEVNKHVPVGFDQLINNHRFVGRLNGVSVLRTTTVVTVSAGAEEAESYKAVALARYGVGSLGLGEKSLKPRIIMKSEGGTYDPLDQIQTLGWKLRGAWALLDANRALIVYSAV